ncbi:Oidioi.mRNA.OKI2018_I69.YSR.g17202.t1.cds [Oikopleura dioica]|uniref:Oidioi.mRNA.OKI2018_I69.YSR.g17202.t1.cds n=1 Tax=Oikopleura dioica TaxID=34765 RepID=A0ABN7SIY4_OIKDI|nr:Oidioi.mRNA.OKI2018_I69.YSR.g17202.t1.cds [Oikopleura dioica]
MDFGQKDNQGKRYLLTCSDSLTGYIDGEPLGTKSDPIVAKNILTLILRHGINNDSFSDNGSEFGPLVAEVFRKFEIRHSRTTAYRSQSNGALERLHREVNTKLKLLNADHRNWSTAWPMVRYYINNLPKSTLDGRSANECYYGRQFHVPFQTNPVDGASKDKWLTGLNKYFDKLHPSILAHQVSRYRKLLARDKNNAPTLEIGSKCLIWKPAFRKLNRVWFGPFTVIKRISKDSYIVKDVETRREYRRHINLIRPLKFKNDPEELPVTVPPVSPDPDTVAKLDAEEVHDMKELKEVCPGEPHINTWANRLRPRHQ